MMSIEDTEADVKETLREFPRDRLANEGSAWPTWIDRVSAATREAPLEMLAMAFLIGALLGRGRR
jgi:hypothetical protein